MLLKVRVLAEEKGKTAFFPRAGSVLFKQTSAALKLGHPVLPVLIKFRNSLLSCLYCGRDFHLPSGAQESCRRGVEGET